MTLGDLIISNVIELLKETQITSASPGWTNTVKDVRVTGLGADFDQELEIAIQEKITEYLAQNSDLVGGNATGKTSTTKNTLSGQKTAGLIRKGGSLIQNPQGIAMEIARYMPHTAFVLIAASVAPMIFELLTKPGGPFDLRFKRIVDKEISAFLSRQTQKDTEFGVRQVIIQSKTGFTAKNGANNYNTVRGIREGGINEELFDRVGRIDHQKGEWPIG